jgi:uncharacterized protein (DUF2235 family)
VWGLLTGYGLDENVLDAYRFLVDTYSEGDRVYLFGFSRGAYTIRVLAGFLRLIDCGEQCRREHLVDASKAAARPELSVAAAALVH